jgi:hypothetical protein
MKNSWFYIILWLAIWGMLFIFTSTVLEVEGDRLFSLSIIEGIFSYFVIVLIVRSRRNTHED